VAVGGVVRGSGVLESPSGTDGSPEAVQPESSGRSDMVGVNAGGELVTARSTDRRRRAPLPWGSGGEVVNSYGAVSFSF